MAMTLASSEEWEWVDLSTLVAVHALVRDAQDALASKATRSWSVERRKAVEDMVDRLAALVRELSWLVCSEDGGGEARHVELLRRRLELLVAGGRDLIDLPVIMALASGSVPGGAADPGI